MADDGPIDLSGLQTFGRRTHYRAICDRCNQSETVVPCAIYDYHIGDGTTHPAMGRVIWCDRCAGIRVGETLPRLPSFETALQDVIERGIDHNEVQDRAKFLRVSPAKELARRTRELRAKVEWLRQRKLPPRCLDCGSISIRECAEPYTHPNCGGRFKLSVESHTPHLTRYAKLGPDGARFDASPSE